MKNELEYLKEKLYINTFANAVNAPRKRWRMLLLPRDKSKALLTRFWCIFSRLSIGLKFSKSYKKASVVAWKGATICKRLAVLVAVFWAAKVTIALLYNRASTGHKVYAIEAGEYSAVKMIISEEIGKSFGLRLKSLFISNKIKYFALKWNKSHCTLTLFFHLKVWIKDFL